MKNSELRDKSVEELHALLTDTKKKIFSAKNSMVQTKKFEDLAENRKRRKLVARIHTIVREKETVRS